MDLAFNAEELAFQQEVRDWITANMPPEVAEESRRSRSSHVSKERLLQWQRKLAEKGWLCPNWPREYGGTGWNSTQKFIFEMEMARADSPYLSSFSLKMVAPVLMKYGSEAQKKRFLPKIAAAEELWCQGYSEPGSGSDLASLRTRAERQGDYYVVNGQKIWTTQAHESKWATLYARTDLEAPKHRGISCLLLDLKAPGITIRPIPMATDTDETFCEVFLDDVEVPATSLLGAENAGWQVAMASLEHERDMIWIMNWVEIWRGLRAVQVHGESLGDDLRVDLGRRLADADALRITGYRTLTSSLRGRRSPEFSILKLLGSEALQRTWELAALASGSAAAVESNVAFERHDALSSSLYGGTSEVQRNIIGERVLGLPKG